MTPDPVDDVLAMKDKCPRCGAAKAQATCDGYCDLYECDSERDPDTGEFIQSDECKVADLTAQLTAANQRIEGLRDAAERLKPILEAFVARPHYIHHQSDLAAAYVELTAALARVGQKEG